MDQKFQTILADRVRNRPQSSITRVKMDGERADQAKGFMLDHVTDFLKDTGKALYEDKGRLEMTQRSLADADSPLNLVRQHEVEKNYVNGITESILGVQKTFDLTLKIGDQIIGPPYDKDWSVGLGFGFFSKNDGKVYAFNNLDYSAAGVGFVLSSDEPASVAITPAGNYNWSYFTYTNSPFVKSQGGMGFTVYVDSDKQPAYSHQPVLWDVSGLGMLEGKNGSGRIADAASPGFGFGTVPLAPVILAMNPGSKYLIWVWCWQLYNNAKDEGFWANIGFDMPLVIISAGPPIVVH